MNTNKNSYTYIFATAMVLIIAVVLAFAATSLKPQQDKNLSEEKMQSILNTIGVKVERSASKDLFDKYFPKQNRIGLDSLGNVKQGVDIFNLNLSSERKLPSTSQTIPLYIGEKDDKKYYVIPLDGDGLWNAIWGYIALEEDMNTIYGVVFDHKSETAGLGAEISTPKFQSEFPGKKIFEANVVEFRLQKGGVVTLPEDKQQYAVDAISGGTLTGDGVTNMIRERLIRYLPYFKKIKEQTVPMTDLVPSSTVDSLNVEPISENK